MRVYTDGACSGNPGPGGWAWAVDPGSVDSGSSGTETSPTTRVQSASGGEAQSTNQRMELQAVLEALRANPGRVEIVSDSTYVVNCFRDKWYEGWIKRGWRTSAKKPVANRDLWEPLVDLYLSRAGEIDFTWVKGHSGDRMNDVVDQLAVDACQAIKTGLPGVAAESETADAPPLDAPWDAGRAVWIIGAGEPDREQRAGLERSIDGLDPDRDVAISGLRRGVELLGAERARRLGVPIGVVLPFDDPANKWPPADRDRFNALVDHANWVVTLSGDRTQPGRAVDARNEWIRQSVAGALVVGDPALAQSLEAQGLSVIALP